MPKGVYITAFMGDFPQTVLPANGKGREGIQKLRKRRNWIMLKVTMILLFVFCFLLASSLGATTEQQLEYITNHVTSLTRQVMLQQFFAETRVRTEGQSGLKGTRLRNSGTKNYFTTTHTGYSAAAMHDHANNDRTVGMGELTAVLNGIEFKTRHNDYRLNMPHQTSTNYNSYEPVPFPDVPPAVTDKPSIDEEITEMREWFKAWRDQNDTVRDYKKYFKPVLCYMEGAWTQSGNKIDEPFVSDRHFVDAASWMELHEKQRYVAYSGSKSILENLSFLPTKIIGLINNTVPNFAQWNYRIMCHPVKRDIPLNRLRVVEDLSSRMTSGRDMHRHKHSRAARFQFNSKDEEKFYDRPLNWKSLLDEIMEEIPGKNNYPADLIDAGMDGPAYNKDKTKLNAGYYHRWFTIDGRDAMGTSGQHRGYNDDFLFTALTTHPKVAGIDLKKCTQKGNPKSCHMLKQKWSYAIPLELIYLTPLSSWNPYKIKHHGNQNRNNLNIIRANGRNGNCGDGEAKAFNGTNSRLYYRTPAAFYSGASVVGKTAADTARGDTCVLDENNKAQQVRASGTHVFLPQIKDVGVLRTRYPVFPVHGEGSSAWKELNALRDITMNAEQWKSMYWKEDDLDASQYSDVELEMGYSRNQRTSKHTHVIYFAPEEILQLWGGHQLEKTTSQSNGHTHTVRVVWNRFNKKYYFNLCDNARDCWDKHTRYFTQTDK